VIAGARRWGVPAVGPVSFAAVPLVAALDLLTGADLGFSPLYAAPQAVMRAVEMRII